MNDSDYYAALPEAHLIRDCITYLESLGCCVWRQNTGAYKVGKRFIRFGAKGISDIIGFTPDGRFLAVECKRKGNKPTVDQAEFLERVKQAGGVAAWVTGYSQLEHILEVGDEPV